MKIIIVGCPIYALISCIIITVGVGFNKMCAFVKFLEWLF